MALAPHLHRQLLSSAADSAAATTTAVRWMPSYDCHNMDAAKEYYESLVPCFAPLAVIAPCFVCYSVSIDSTHLRFGYLTACFRAKIERSDIDSSSVTTGSSSCMENLSSFGGWGIRMGPRGSLVYNPTNGPWVELKTSAGRAYRFATNNAEQVAAILRGGACEAGAVER